MLVTGFTKQNSPYILGIAGGSGSGKTYFAQALKKTLSEDFCEVILQDSFYIDQSARFDFDGGSVNFDHPQSIDFTLLAEKLKSLKQGRAVEVPIYDFVTHSRLKKTVHVQPKRVILVDGILIFHSEILRPIFDDLIFFDTHEELRFSRRLHRDVHERGRTEQGVRAQFQNQVKPMHDTFVEPSKRFANTVVSETDDFSVVLAAYEKKLTAICRNRS